MTQQRSNDEIDADLDERLYGHVGDRLVANARLALDVAPLLARAERAEADRDALRARIGEALGIADDGGSYRKVERMAAALAAGLSLQEEQE